MSELNANIHLTVNGKRVACAPGQRLLDVLLAQGIDVPRLCDDPRLAPAGACRLCMVEIEGRAQPVASCTEPAAEGMVVRTHPLVIERLRRTNLELIAQDYPRLAAQADPQQPFHRLLAQYGVEARGAGQRERYSDDTHPYLGVDMDRCIECQRCVRICAELQGQFIWHAWQRGEQTHIAPAGGQTLLEAGCVSCGACVDACPSGALFDKRSPEAPERWTRSTCVYCGVGCQMEVGTVGNRVVQVKPADHPVNRGHLCAKGRYAWEFNTASDRVTVPMIRRNGEWQRVSWDEALEFTAASLLRIQAQHGAQSIGLLGSARATNEENHLIGKLARVVLGTNNVDTCARVCHTPTAKAMKLMLGTGAATNGFDDIERAATILICGCNPTENHPVVGARIKQAVRRGAKLIMIDPRRTELAGYADVHLALRPGTNLPLLNAMAAAILDEGLVDEAFLRERVTGLTEFAKLMQDYAPETMQGICGVPAADIRAAARLYASQRPSMCFHGLGVTEHLQGTEGVMALINLALLTGNIGRPGAGINPLRGQNNVQGAALMGCEPNTLTGGQSIKDAGARFEALWDAPIPTEHGLDLLQMMDAARSGALRAMWVFGYDIYLTLANAQATGASLEKLDLVIIQDLFMNETAKAFGTVFLPAASFLERDGTFMNADRRVQRVRAAVDAPGEARPDGWIIQEIARRLGVQRGFGFDGPQGIWDEVRALWPAVAGLSYARMDETSIQWPCPREDHPGTSVLHVDRFAGGPTAALRCIAYEPTPERCDAAFSLMLTTGRRLLHFNAGTMTYRTPNRELETCDTLDMCAEDAQRLGLAQGDEVRVHSRHGEALLPLRISASVKRGEVFASFHRAERFLNRVTSGVRDRMVHSPEYKVTAVRVERAGG